MNEIDLYNRASKLKRYSKRIQQLSFSLNRLESRFNLDDLETKEIKSLIEAYEDSINELIKFVNEMKNENKDYTY